MFYKKGDAILQRENGGHLGVDDDSGTDGDEGGDGVEVEGDAKERPAHLSTSSIR